MSAPAHSPCSADVSRRPIGRGSSGSRQGSCLICNLRLTSAHPGHIFAGKWHPSATSALRPGPPLPRLRRDWAHHCHSCTGTGLGPQLAPGPGSPLPDFRHDWAHPCHICTGTWPNPCHIRAGSGLIPAISAPGLGPSLSHLRQDWAHPFRLFKRTGLILAISAPGLGPSLSNFIRTFQILRKATNSAECCLFRRFCKISAVFLFRRTVLNTRPRRFDRIFAKGQAASTIFRREYAARGLGARAKASKSRA